jgi:hypothetical protein
MTCSCTDYAVQVVPPADGRLQPPPEKLLIRRARVDELFKNLRLGGGEELERGNGTSCANLPRLLKWGVPISGAE